MNLDEAVMKILLHTAGPTWSGLQYSKVEAIVLQMMSRKITDETANVVVEKIEDDISDRAGLGDAWCMITADVKKDIRQDWKHILKGVIQ